MFRRVRDEFRAANRGCRDGPAWEPFRQSGIDLVARGHLADDPMPHKLGTLAPNSNARLDELMSLLGCENEIAPLDAKAFGRRAGDLIARAASESGRSKTRKRNPVKRNPAARKGKTAH